MKEKSNKMQLKCKPAFHFRSQKKLSTKKVAADYMTKYDDIQFTSQCH
jgi:hypothetical protein